MVIGPNRDGDDHDHEADDHNVDHDTAMSPMFILYDPVTNISAEPQAKLVLADHHHHRHQMMKKHALKEHQNLQWFIPKDNLWHRSFLLYYHLYKNTSSTTITASLFEISLTSGLLYSEESTPLFDHCLQ